MELTISLNILPTSEKFEIIDTLESLPWDQEGIDLVIYSEDSKKVKKIIKEEGLESTLLNGKMEVLLCEEPYSSDNTYMNIALEDCKTELITFLKPGDTIEFFDPDLLLSNENFDLGLGNIEGRYPVASTCFESRMLPVSTDGMIFSAKFLKKNELVFGDEFLPKLFNCILTDIESPEYSNGWGKYDIDELFSVSPGKELDLDKEQRLPKIYVGLWKDHEVDYNYYLRELMWNRMARAAAIVIKAYKDSNKNISLNLFDYLLPDNMVSILS